MGCLSVHSEALTPELSPGGLQDFLAPIHVIAWGPLRLQRTVTAEIADATAAVTAVIVTAAVRANITVIATAAVKRY